MVRLLISQTPGQFLIRQISQDKITIQFSANLKRTRDPMMKFLGCKQISSLDFGFTCILGILSHKAWVV